MADPLSMASGIAGLVALADLVFTKTLRYVREVKAAEKSIKSIAHLMQSMSGTLHVLRQRLLVFAAEPSRQQMCLRPQILTDCAELLEDVNRKLSEYDKTAASTAKHKLSSRLRNLKWPLDASSTNDLLNQLTKFNDVLNTALAADTMIAVHQVFQAAGQLQEDIKKLERSMSAKVNKLTAIILDQKQDEAVSYFRSHHAIERHKIAMRLRQPGTGKWLTESDDLQRWIDGHDPKLWLSGIPGAGKTVLASAIIERAREASVNSKGDTAFAFYYCDYKDAATQDSSNILSSLIAQIAVHNQKALDILVEHYSKFCKPGRVSAHEDPPSQMELFGKLSGAFHRVLVIVDGLDECGNNTSNVAIELSELNSQDSSRISTLFLSRAEQEISHVLSNTCLHIPIAARNNDLRLYVYAQMERKTAQGSLFIDDPDVKTKIIETLVNKAEGMFRWVACQMDYLCELATDSEREAALNDLPPDLNSTYERILQRINQKPPSIQRLVLRTLRWLILSKEPLTVVELQEVLAVEVDDTSLNTRRKPHEQVILRNCSSLIRMSDSPRGSILEPAHFTVEEYLTNNILSSTEFAKYGIESVSGNLDLALTCLSYLNLNDFGHISAVGDTQGRFSKFSFRVHAVKFWAKYAQGQHDNSLWIERAKRLLKPESTPNFLSWIHDLVWLARTYQLHPTRLSSPTSSFSEPMSPSSDADHWETIALHCQRAVKGVTVLHAASFLRMPTLVKWLLDSGMEVNAKSALGCPIHCSILGPNTMRCSGINFDVEDLDSFSEATVDTIRVLTNCGADASIQYQNLAWGQQTSTAYLMLSIRLPRPPQLMYDAIDLLLIAGIKVDALTGANIMSLTWRFRQVGIELIARFTKADIEETYLNDFMDSLVKLGDPDLLRHFGYFERLQVNEMSERRSKEVDSQLRLFSQYDQHQALEELLKHEIVDIDAIDELKGSTALHVAAYSGSLKAARVLINNKANVNLQNKCGEMPLHKCADTANAGIAELLLLHGADLYPKNQEGLTPWAIAARYNYVDILKVWFLSERSRESDIVGQLTDTLGPLFLAASGRADDAVMFLTSNELYVNLLQDDGRNLAHYCANLSLSTLQSLSIRGLKFNLPDETGRTPLHSLADRCALGSNYSHVNETYFKLVIKEGCSVANKCREGNTPSHLLMKNTSINSSTRTGFQQFSAILDVLLTEETMTVCNNDGKTPLDCFIEVHWGLEGGASCIDELLRRRATFGPDQAPVAYVAKQLLSCNPETWSSHARSGVDMLAKLIDVGPDSEEVIRGPIGVQISLWALEHFESGLLIKLLVSGVSCTARPPDGSSSHLLHRVMLDDHIREIYDRVMESISDSDLMHSDPSNDYTYLHRLCSFESKADSRLIRVLLIRGLNVDARATNGTTPLMLATRNGKLDHVRLLIEHGADVQATDDFGASAFCWAVMSGQLPTVKYFVTQHADSLRRDAHVRFGFDMKGAKMTQEGCQLPHLAIFAPSVLGYLIESLPSLNIDATTNDGNTPLLIAAGANQEITVTLLIKNGADVNATNSRQFTVLHAAVSSNCGNIVRLLCKNGAEVDKATQEVGTPLIYAAMLGFVDIARLLLEAGASTSVLWKGLTPELIALSRNHSAVVELLRDHAQTQGGQAPDQKQQIGRSYTTQAHSTLRDAITNRNHESINALLNAGFDWGEALPFCAGCSPLSAALESSDAHAAKILIEQGHYFRFEKCQHTSLRGYTALHLTAVSHKLGEIQAMILSKMPASDIGATLPVPWLHICVASNNMEGLRCFLEHYKKVSAEVLPGIDAFVLKLNELDHSWIVEGLDIEALEDYTSSGNALHTAAWCDRCDAASLLVASGANVNTPNNGYDTPLHFAACNGSLGMVRFLLANGADIEARDSRGCTPLTIAAVKGNADVVNLLCESGATLHTADLQEYCRVFRTDHSASLAVLISKGIAANQIDRFYKWLDCWMPNEETMSLVLSSYETVSALIASRPNLLGSMIYQESQSTYTHRLLRWFAKNGLLPTHLNNANPSPLCIAVQKGHIPTIELLLQAGADINLPGCDEGTPLAVACTINRFEIAKLLVRRGASIHYLDSTTTTSNPRSCFDCAKRYPRIQRWLLVERWTDQKRIAHGEGSTQEVKFWSGFMEVSAPLGMDYMQFGDETLLEWYLRKRKKLRLFEGRVLHYGPGIEFPFVGFA